GPNRESCSRPKCPRTAIAVSRSGWKVRSSSLRGALRSSRRSKRHLVTEKGSSARPSPSGATTPTQQLVRRDVVRDLHVRGIPMNRVAGRADGCGAQQDHLGHGAGLGKLALRIGPAEAGIDEALEMVELFYRWPLHAAELVARQDVRPAASRPEYRPFAADVE